jgi:hypothetical protein
MSLLRRIFSSRARAASKQVCIVDANGFIEKRYREANGLPSPRDNFYVLKTLAYFAQREDIEMMAVFCGRPLREAGEGESFKGVAVYYANDEKSLFQKIRRLACSGTAHKEAVIITDDRQIEREAMKEGVQCMRLTTLKRGMEGGFDHDRQPHPIQRRTADSAPSAQRLGTAKAGSAVETEQPSPSADEKTDKNVFDLIDPI